MYVLNCPHLYFSLIWKPNFKAINFSTRAKEQPSWGDLFETESLWFRPWIWRILRQHMFLFALRRFWNCWRLRLNYKKGLRIPLHNKCCTKKFQHGPTRYILNISKKYRNICIMTTIFQEAATAQRHIYSKCLIRTHYMSDILWRLTPQLPGKCWLSAEETSSREIPTLVNSSNSTQIGQFTGHTGVRWHYISNKGEK